jgi:hypothetical protein
LLAGEVKELTSQMGYMFSRKIAVPVVFRYASGDVKIPEPAASVRRALVLLRLTVSARKFGEIAAEFTKE